MMIITCQACIQSYSSLLRIYNDTSIDEGIDVRSATLVAIVSNIAVYPSISILYSLKCKGLLLNKDERWPCLLNTGLSASSDSWR